MITIEITPTGSIYANCDKCPWVSVNRSMTASGRAQLFDMGQMHVEIEHSNDYVEKGDYIGHVGELPHMDVSDVVAHVGTYPHMVTAQDFTESHQEEGDNKTMKTLQDALRVKNMRIRELNDRMHNIAAHDLEMSENYRLARHTIDKQTHRIESQETLIEDLKTTIEDLMKTPDPMPLCKNPEGHNYVPLDHYFVFCTHCGHSIHYKTK